MVGAELSVERDAWQRVTVRFGWGGRAFEFFPNAILGEYRLPTIDGAPIEIETDHQYEGPHLNLELGGSKVRASYDDYALLYDFETDTITRA